MRDGGWSSEAMVARYTEHLQVKQGASAILAARQARLQSAPFAVPNPPWFNRVNRTGCITCRPSGLQQLRRNR